MFKNLNIHTHTCSRKIQFSTVTAAAAAAAVAVASASDEASDGERSAAGAKGARRLLQEASKVVKNVYGAVEVVDVLLFFLQEYLV